MYLSQNSLICWTRVVQNYWLLDPSQIIHFSLPFIFCFFKKRGKKRKKQEVHWDQGKANKLPTGQEKMEPCLKTTKATRSIVFFHLFYNLQFISYRFVSSLQVDFIMEILSRLVGKQVNIFPLLDYLWIKVSSFSIWRWVVTDMEISQVVGRLFEVCTLDKASII